MIWLKENWFKLGILVAIFVIAFGFLFQRAGLNFLVKNSKENASQSLPKIGGNPSEKELISEISTTTPATSTPTILGENTTTEAVILKPSQTKTIVKRVDNSEAIKKAQQEVDDAKIAQHQAEEKAAALEAQQKLQQVAQQKINCENLLNKKNAELFKFKEEGLNLLEKIQQGMAQSKAGYQTRLVNAYGNQPLWDSIYQEMSDNAAKWQELMNKTNSYLDTRKAEIDALPVCPNY